MTDGNRGNLPRPTVGQFLGIAGLCLTLATTSQAQDVEAGCPLPPEAPAFVAHTVDELGSIKPHTERWREPLPWQQLLRELDRLRLDGLNPQDYLVSDLARIADQLRAGMPPTPCQSRLASLALAWSLSDLTHGRLDPEELGLMWHKGRQRPDAERLAINIHRDFYHQQGLRQAYRNARPSIRPYQALRAAFRDQRRNWPESWPTVPPGPTLRQGDSGPRVTALTRRLAIQGYLTVPGPESTEGGEPRPDQPGATLFDDQLEQAVTAFQRNHGLTADGLAGRSTLETLNLPPGVWSARTRANLERLRWIAPYYTDNMVLVDIAGAQVQLVRDGREVWRGNTQVGRPERKTPALTSTISHITVNPTWTIPPTVFHEDTLPAIQADPDYLTRNQLTVLDHSGTELDPREVDWSSPGNLLLRQAAGPGNALGEVVIRFPNPFAVYLHDTPSRRLFDRPDRFYSSGCVRVENAMQLTQWLFREAPEHTLERIGNLRRSGDTRNVSLPDQLRLVMAYWTAEAGPEGQVRYRQDTYEEDRLVIDLLGQEP
ncbi:L,D-transpeptidase family protein [Marinobacter zhanjiangensis]|uniref:Peptidoglycan-binding protein n=1 Tax=Marinobacter zhanjiangensis TaxID=578215 RepID=A0ABQ3AY05_9GAMM|nr:L,D-transpeptidase family protein [Marinobacter zhanjiangensis]GGY70230.1 peptidoglycan-binding protein [Marinobacter zhanjiangensis]